MHRQSPVAHEESEAEYRAIEAALVESARGRWFLAEHGRRARRLDGAMLEDAIGRLQTSLREPPALLGQLEAAVGALKAHIETAKRELLERPASALQAASGGIQPQAILQAAENIHEIAWSLQANPFDPKSCEAIARDASRLYALSHTQAAESERALAFAAALDEALRRIEAILETVAHEKNVDEVASARF